MTFEVTDNRRSWTRFSYPELPRISRRRYRRWTIDPDIGWCAWQHGVLNDEQRVGPPLLSRLTPEVISGGQPVALDRMPSTIPESQQAKMNADKDCITDYYEGRNRGGWYSDQLKKRAADLLDDPDFAGIVFQHWHWSGNERMPKGSPEFAPRHVGLDLIERLLDRANTQPDWFSARPVFYRGSNRAGA